jgi:NitT/TauT family transport system ATP-binding protein
MPHEKLRKSNFLHIQDVYKSYGPNLVLDDIDLSVAAGEFCTVVGPSGCGKSTLLRLILGQEEANSGEILIDGETAGPPDLRRGVVYQKYSLFPHLTVLENVLLGTKINPHHKCSKDDKERAIRYLERVKLGDSLDKYPHELSGGMQQRVAVIQTLFVNPKVVLMDEPFGALDPGTREDLQVFLLELWEEYKMTLFFVTHDLEEALYLGTRLIVLSQYYEGHPREDGKQGAKIVMDLNIKDDQKAYSTAAKYSENFQDLLATVRRDGFDPSYRQHVNDFNLKHDHSFRTEEV